MTITRVLMIGLAAAGLAAVAQPTGAAVIAWGTPTTIAGDSDVSTWQTLDRAYNFHRTNISTPAIVIAPTVNGVTFDSFAIRSIAPFASGYGTGTATSVTVGSTTLSVSADGIGALNKDVYGKDGSTYQAPFKNLSVGYQDMVGSEIEEDYRTTTVGLFTLSLAGLTNGSQYQIQIWADDSRTNSSGDRITTLTAGNAVQLDQNTTNANGGLGQYVIGAFTANSATQALTINGKVSAFQLRTVPEPASLTLLALGGLAMLRRRR